RGELLGQLGQDAGQDPLGQRRRALRGLHRGGEQREHPRAQRVQLRSLEEVPLGAGGVAVQQRLQAAGARRQPVVRLGRPGGRRQLVVGPVEQAEHPVPDPGVGGEQGQLLAHVAEFDEGVEGGGDPVDPLLQGAPDVLELGVEPPAGEAQLGVELPDRLVLGAVAGRTAPGVVSGEEPRVDQVVPHLRPPLCPAPCTGWDAADRGPVPGCGKIEGPPTALRLQGVPPSAAWSCGMSTPPSSTPRRSRAPPMPRRSRGSPGSRWSTSPRRRGAPTPRSSSRSSPATTWTPKRVRNRSRPTWTRWPRGPPGGATSSPRAGGRRRARGRRWPRSPPWRTPCRRWSPERSCPTRWPSSPRSAWTPTSTWPSEGSVPSTTPRPASSSSPGCAPARPRARSSPRSPPSTSPTRCATSRPR